MILLEDCNLICSDTAHNCVPKVQLVRAGRRQVSWSHPVCLQGTPERAGRRSPLHLLWEPGVLARSQMHRACMCVCLCVTMGAGARAHHNHTALPLRCLVRRTIHENTASSSGHYRHCPILKWPLVCGHCGSQRGSSAPPVEQSRGLPDND